MKNIAVFLSGRGSNFINIHKNIQSGYIHSAEVAVVFSNCKDAKGLEYAVEHGIDIIVIDHLSYDNRSKFDQAIVDALEIYNIDLICLAGYMRIVTDVIINRYPNRIINIHPSLLPAFQGMNAQKQAIDYGVKYSGCTIHFVDSGVDTGMIILQDIIFVEDSDDAELLSAKILLKEHLLYVEAINLFCEDKLVIKENKVFIKN